MRTQSRFLAAAGAGTGVGLLLPPIAGASLGTLIACLYLLGRLEKTRRGEVTG